MAAVAAVDASEVAQCQADWARAIVAISDAYRAGDAYVGVAEAAVDALYAYAYAPVLFKPTLGAPKGARPPLRPTRTEALSYFVGHRAVGGAHEDDAGFAHNGGRGWAHVALTNHRVEVHGSVAVAMGTYAFTCATTGDEVEAEYTFGYARGPDGRVRLFLHHSSMPWRE